MSDRPADFREEYTPPKDITALLTPEVILAFVAGILFVGLILLGSEINFLGGSNNTQAYITNVFTEVLSILVTVWWLGRRQDRQRILLEKKRLVHEAGSQSNERAKAAIDDLRYLEWLKGDHGLLKRAFLEDANLQGAFLEHANLQGAFLARAQLQGAMLLGAKLQDAMLPGANLQGAMLRYADLEGAMLLGAKLQDATLWGADLEGANLMSAKLQGADLIAAQLQGAFLKRADLEGAIVWDAALDEKTTLPDGTMYKPELGLEQLERFGANVKKNH